MTRSRKNGIEPCCWLPELLVIANGTGRRIGSICALRVEDLKLDPGPNTPFGCINWRAENDKEGYDWRDIPIDGDTRSAVLRALEKRRVLGRVGVGPLFPSPSDPDRPITPDRANLWFRAAETLEGDDLDPLTPMPEGRTFHGYRSKWAVETKHMPGKDRAEVGGWKSEATIRLIYDKVDPDTMLRIVTERGTLREEFGS